MGGAVRGLVLDVCIAGRVLHSGTGGTKGKYDWGLNGRFGGYMGDESSEGEEAVGMEAHGWKRGVFFWFVVLYLFWLVQGLAVGIVMPLLGPRISRGFGSWL